MNFSAWAIRRPIPSILLFFALTVCGLFGFYKMQVEAMPDIAFPVIKVLVAYPGATPGQIETEITRKVEGALANIEGVRHIYSTATEGVSDTILQFQLNKDMRLAMDSVRNAMASVRSSLPIGVKDPYITRIEVIGDPVLTYIVEAKGKDIVDLSWFVDDKVGKALLGVEGVGAVTRHGGVNREVLVELDPLRLQALGITPLQVAEQIAVVQQDASGGLGKLAGAEQALRAVGRAQSVEELKGQYLSLGLAPYRVQLRDIAQVKDSIAERYSLAVYDGRSVVSVEIQRAKGASELVLAEQVRAAMKALGQQNPDIKITEISSVTVSFILQEYGVAMRALLEGALLTLIVVWFFLREWRATVVSAVALPLSIIPTFFFMYVLGFTLNTVTLLGLTLIIGVLVDDAIVEVENIIRHLSMGKTPMQAALDAADEIGLAVIGTSLALVAVFLPTAFVGGPSGELFKQFGGTTTFAVLGSLLVARLLTPMMAAYFFKPLNPQEIERAKEQDSGKVMRAYLNLVRWCLKHSFSVSVAAVLFFGSSIFLAGLLPFDFLPRDNRDEVQITVTAPPGENINRTADLLESVRRSVMQEPGVRNVLVTAGSAEQLGSSAGDGSSSNTGKVWVFLDHKRSRSMQEIESAIRKRLVQVPGGQFAVGADDGSTQYTLSLQGEDPQLLQDTALKIAADMRSLPGFGAVSTSADLVRPEVVVRRDPQKAADLGVSSYAISQVLRVATGGEDTESLSKINLVSRQVPIRVRLSEKSRKDLGALSMLRVPAKTATVALSDVASLSIESGLARIDRQDRMRMANINMELDSKPLSQAAAMVNGLPSVQKLPAGITQVAVGLLEAQQEMAISFAIAMLAGVLSIYIILTLLLNNFLQPFTILFALPLSAGGAFAALWLLGMSFSMPVMIGILMLAGVVCKNSILLVDYAEVAERTYGLSRLEAIVDACHKRARPIIMTTMAMVSGMLPLAFGVGGDSGFRGPMAVVVIGGLLSSTLLSLLLVPVVYEMVDKLQARFKFKNGS